MRNIPGKHEVKELQKTAILGTANILQNILIITVRLTFLTQSIGMKPNFQALLWVEFGGFVYGEL